MKKKYTAPNKTILQSQALLEILSIFQLHTVKIEKIILWLQCRGAIWIVFIWLFMWYGENKPTWFLFYTIWQCHVIRFGNLCLKIEKYLYTVQCSRICTDTFYFEESNILTHHKSINAIKTLNKSHINLIKFWQLRTKNISVNV